MILHDMIRLCKRKTAPVYLCQSERCVYLFSFHFFSFISSLFGFHFWGFGILWYFTAANSSKKHSCETWLSEPVTTNAPNNQLGSNTQDYISPSSTNLCTSSHMIANAKSLPSGLVNMTLISQNSGDTSLCCHFSSPWTRPSGSQLSVLSIQTLWMSREKWQKLR